jgi:hypothetical protein
MNHNRSNKVLKNLHYVFEMDLSNIVIWIAIWGISDNILNVFVSYDNYYLRIIIYVILLIIAFQVKLYLYDNKYISV